MSRIERKPVFGVSDQIGDTVTDVGYRQEISDLGSREIVHLVSCLFVF